MCNKKTAALVSPLGRAAIGSRRPVTVCQWIEVVHMWEGFNTSLCSSMPVDIVNKKLTGELAPHVCHPKDICFCMYLLLLIPPCWLLATTHPGNMGKIVKQGLDTLFHAVINKHGSS